DRDMTRAVAEGRLVPLDVWRDRYVDAVDAAQVAELRDELGQQLWLTRLVTDAFGSTGTGGWEVETLRFARGEHGAPAETYDPAAWRVSDRVPLFEPATG